MQMLSICVCYAYVDARHMDMPDICLTLSFSLRSEKSKNEKTAHLVWCAMIALRLARLQSEQQENLFLVRWFADAERQRRFSRDVATDIRWMLQQGRSLGVRAQLARKLDYIWRSTTGNIMEQTELFRLTWGLETAKSQ